MKCMKSKVLKSSVRMKDGGEVKAKDKPAPGRASKMTAKDVPVGEGKLGEAKKALTGAEARRQAAIKAAGG